MDTIIRVVAQNIKHLRVERKLSLEELSRVSGVSKSMLALIERGDGNPTLNSLWKIANGLQIPFDALTVRSQPNCEIIRLSEIDPILEDNGKVKNFPIFPDDQNRHFSVFYMQLQPGSCWKSDAHVVDTTEFILVTEGEVEIQAGEQVFHVKKDEGIHFQSDTQHGYRNVSEGVTKLYMIMYSVSNNPNNVD